MRRCSTCVMPESTPGIVFDHNGVCNYCATYQKFDYKGEQKLLKILIREGLITREHALSRLKNENKLHLDIIEEILSRLGIEKLHLPT